MTFRRRGSMRCIYCFDFDSFLNKNEIALIEFAEDREEMEDFADEVLYYWDIEFKDSDSPEMAEEEKEQFIKDLNKYFGMN